ncbi:tRNase Z endonuclease [Teratosphaeria destructans]|uniref:ribonuclease Z n=1 Tax=Teratosphaeria destructans TaxID=418781 RepID=A0A9W7SZK0_9PEZI|nr:tRNase Z endonuclease [Teratosphaeria destructans]
MYAVHIQPIDAVKVGTLAPALHYSGRITTSTTSRSIAILDRGWLKHRSQFHVARSRVYSTQSAAKSGAGSASRPIASQIKDLLFGKEEANPVPQKPVQPPEPIEERYAAAWEPIIKPYEYRPTPTERWATRRHRLRLGTWKSETNESKTGDPLQPPVIQFREKDFSRLLPPHSYAEFKSWEHVALGRGPMKSHVQILTTPTADTPGTSLLLHFDNKRYLVGNMSEGTQRAGVQMGARLLKVSECFITGRTEWNNTGGVIGMILTLADANSSSVAASNGDATKKKAWAKGKHLGLRDDPQRMKELEEEAKRDAAPKLTLFSPPNLNHMLATARRFVFRKGMPVDVHEIVENSEKTEGADYWAPYFADENIKVWAMSISPSASSNGTPLYSKTVGSVSPRKRSINEVYEREPVPDGNGASIVTASSLTPKQHAQLTAKAVVGEMFNSSWRLDTLHETPLSHVRLPAAIFVKDSITNKIQKYKGPLPNGDTPLPDPDLRVLVRKPWPGALVENLPPIEPAKEAISYIIRNHTQRGKFHPDRAVKLKVERGLKWSQLSKGNNVLSEDGETITPDMVLGEPKEGGGIAVVDIPDASYIEPLLSRPEWRVEKIMTGVGGIVWICGRGVASDPRVQDFMKEFAHIQHIISSPEHCPNNIALDSAAAATARLRQIDPTRYNIPVHSNDPEDASQLPKGVHRAVRGLTIQLEPSFEVQTKQVVPCVDIAAIEAAMSPEVLEEGKTARSVIKDLEGETRHWASQKLPKGAADVEVTTLGTGSALPSKYRNVSSTLLRVPGWGCMLFDAGENTMGQLRRVFPPDELKQILRDLRMIWISHMHADHHLGTVAVIKAWYQEVHNSIPATHQSDASPKDVFDTKTGLAVVSETSMQHWLYEYSSVEDYGFSRLAPLYISTPQRAPSKSGAPIQGPSKIGWFIPPSTLAALSDEQRHQRLALNTLTPEFLNLADIRAVAVKHCLGARAVSVTFPSGFKASYSGDCRPCQAFSEIGQGSTVVIHEATFDDELRGDAEAKHHSTTSEALRVAQAMGAKTCILTHFSQRYQKLPIMHHGDGGTPEGLQASVEDTFATADDEEDTTNPEDEISGPLQEDVPTTTNDTGTASGSSTSLQPPHSEPAVNVRLKSDMKVCVAFDYMRVKVGQIPQMERFTPALLKLFEEEKKKVVEEIGAVEGAGGKTGGKQNGGKQGGQQGVNGKKGKVKGQ